MSIEVVRDSLEEYEEAVKFDWNITATESRYLEIQLNFDKAHEISAFGVDKLNVTLTNPSYYLPNKAEGTPPYESFVQTLPG